jgi:hypothetical protein
MPIVARTADIKSNIQAKALSINNRIIVFTVLAENQKLDG